MVSSSFEGAMSQGLITTRIMTLCTINLSVMTFSTTLIMILKTEKLQNYSADCGNLAHYAECHGAIFRCAATFDLMTFVLSSATLTNQCCKVA
jgi:hypothetical protein